jgi:hypothetical protein
MFAEERLKEAINELVKYRAFFIGKLTQADKAITHLQELLGVEPEKPLLRCPNCQTVSVLRLVLDAAPEGCTLSENGDSVQEPAGSSQPNEIVVSSKSEPEFPAGTFFNKSQREAATEVLRRYDRPMAMIEILNILKREKFAFKTGNPYPSLFKTMTRGTEFVKSGKEWQLKDWGKNREKTGGLFSRMMNDPKFLATAANGTRLHLDGEDLGGEDEK